MSALGQKQSFAPDQPGVCFAPKADIGQHVGFDLPVSTKVVPQADALHAGLPVEDGCKMIITKWFRER
jgi:hypothetical protein